MNNSIEMIRPDDWHVHLREEDVLADACFATARNFSRALLMPNLKTPLNSISKLSNYRQEVNKIKPANFKPYFTLYLTDDIQGSEIEGAAKEKDILGAKLYPAGATTNSQQGINSLRSLYPIIELMQEHHLVLQVHGETTHGDIFHREKKFIEEELAPLSRNFPKLRMVLEHISTKAAVDFVTQSNDLIAATITVHHLLYNRNHLLAGGIKPHYYCLPILKNEISQLSVQKAALSGNPKFFLGTDSAPHAISDKESACGCAGIFSAPYALELYTQFFAKNDKLDKLEAFASKFGADFYQKPYNSEKIKLIKKEQKTKEVFKLGNKNVKPIEANSTIEWSVIND